jgi:Zn-dependent protease/CBS domain-containing protein
MHWSYKLFQFKGIDVKVHLTFVLILLWAAWNWSGSSPVPWQGAAFGVVAILLLFASVTLHEFGHSLMALRYGVRVSEIILLPIGGVSQMEAIPEKPREELLITLAGPLVNFAIAGVLIGVGVLLQAAAVVTIPELLRTLGSATWEGLLAYLTMSNLILGVFNLIPAFPMDGGRIMRAVLAMRLSHRQATAIAATVGQAMAWLLGLWGFASGSYSLILIAIFIWLGASQEGKSTEVRDVFGAMTVGQATTRQVQTLSASDTIAKAVDLTLTTFQSDFPVLDLGRVVGLLTQADVLRALHTQGDQVRVGQVMQTGLPAATADEPLSTVQQRMVTKRTHTVVVLAADHSLIGLLTAADINEAYLLQAATPPALAPAKA